MKQNKKNSYYRSGLEEKFAQLSPRAAFQYEPYRIPYTIHKDYIPDFVYNNGNNTYLIECKGFFRVGDTQKYKAIRDSLPDGQELIFLFSDKYKKVRKGSKLTMEKWCDKEGFKCYVLGEIEELFKYVGV